MHIFFSRSDCQNSCLTCAAVWIVFVGFGVAEFTTNLVIIFVGEKALCMAAEEERISLESRTGCFLQQELESSMKMNAYLASCIVSGCAVPVDSRFICTSVENKDFVFYELTSFLVKKEKPA